MKDLHGIHIPGHKNTSAMKATKLPLPQSVVIPMAMHIGAPAKPVVKVGDHVILHVGYALQKIDPEEAQKTLALFASEASATGEPA